MHDIEQTLAQSKRLNTTSHQLLKKIKKLLRQSEKIIQQSRAAILNS
jgi:tRNA U55 pseudouridine synthase TruB